LDAKCVEKCQVTVGMFEGVMRMRRISCNRKHLDCYIREC
jgi:hypothetical protein